jgi:hypothetical protein
VSGAAASSTPGSGDHAAKLRRELQRGGVAYFASQRALQQFAADLEDEMEAERWRVLRTHGTVLVGGTPPAAPPVDECESLEEVRRMYPDDDLVVCSDTQAAQRFGLPARRLVAATRPTVSGLSGMPYVHVLGQLAERFADDYSESTAQGLRDLFESAGVRRYMRHVDEVAVADRWLLPGDSARDRQGFAWFLELLGSEPPVSGARTLRVYTGAPSSVAGTPTAAQAAAIIDKLGLRSPPPSFDRIGIYLLSLPQI